MGESDQDYLNQLDDLVTVLSMAPRDQGQVPDSRLIVLQSMLAHSRAVLLDYHSNFKDERTRRTVEPLGLCFYAGNWHLLAFCHLRREYRDFRVDRIKSLEPTGRQFDRSRHGDLDRLVRNIVLPAELKPATLRFTPHAARRIGDQKYYFGFVRQYEQNGGIIMEFLVPDYDYMARWLLSFVDQVAVISPASLEQTVAALVRKLSAHYPAPGKGF
jgi:predicted DNA-binding transcriptional regulator YafY